MGESYFLKVKETTPTRLWINNPTLEEIGLAQAQGAVGCTTNPSFGGGLLKRAPDQVLPILAACAAQAGDDLRAADLVQQELVARIAGHFLGIWEKSGGKAGFVSIQGAPDADTDGHHILQEALEGHARGPNVTPKIPATLPGFYAFEKVVEAGYPTIITEVFSLDQVVMACEVYIRATDKTGVRPPFHMSPITGIFADYLKKVAGAREITIDPRSCQALVEERKYPVTLLFGGARTMMDFTGLVGAASASTINYSTVAEILEANPPIEDSIHAPVDPQIIEKLNLFEDFRNAMTLGAVKPEEFIELGAVHHFRDLFLAGWHAVIAGVGEARKEK